MMALCTLSMSTLGSTAAALGPPPPPPPWPPYYPCLAQDGPSPGMLTTLAAEARPAGDFSQILNYGQPVPPPPRKGQVLIRVNASSVNPVDWKIVQTGANMGLRFPHILGFDVAGEVASCPSCTRLKVGDQVWADLGKRWLLRGGELGAYAQCVIADEDQVGLLPPSLSYGDGGVLPLVGLTSLQALREAWPQQGPPPPPAPPPMPSLGCVMWRQTKNCDPNGQPEPADGIPCAASIPSGNSGFCECSGGLRRQLANCSHNVLPSCAQVCEATQPPSPPPACLGCKVFITSGAGGTGHVAVQIAKAWGGNVTAVGGTNDAYFMLRLGADATVDYQTQSNIFEGIPENSLDVVYDNFGAPGTADHAMAALKPGGTFIFLPGRGGAVSKSPKKGVRQIDYGLLDPTNHTDLDALSVLVENRKLRPYVQQTFSIDGGIPAAFNLSMQGKVQGKIGVLVPAVPLPPAPAPGPPGPACSQYNCEGSSCDTARKECNAVKDCWFEMAAGDIFICIYCWGRGYCSEFVTQQTCAEDQACGWSGTDCSWLGPEKDPSCQPPPLASWEPQV